jgi:endogenous inhibitor of DNA gyrase (YacG/DUF329 family)
LFHGGRSRKDFCDNNGLCRNRYYRVGPTGTSYLEERYRSTCKRCGNPIIQPKHGGKYFCSGRCLQSYHRILQTGVDDRERWGQYAPKTQKVLCELEDAKMSGVAKRLATAIDCEYVPRTKSPPTTSRNIPNQTLGKMASYICKGCGTEFRRRELSTRNRDYCSNRCQLKTEQGIESGRGLKGEDHAQAKVTWEQVDEIRSLYASNQMSARVLGEKYGLDKTSIYSIVSGRKWKPENDPRRKQASEGKQV